MNNLTFNGIRKPFVTVLEKGRPYWAARKRNIRSIRGREYGRLESTDIETLMIPVTLLIEGDSKTDLLDKMEEVAGWLLTDEEKPLIFDDRPNRTYYAAVDGDMEFNEFVTFTKVQITFVCPDSHKFGQTENLSLTTTLQDYTISGQVETYWTSYTKFTAAQSQFTLETDKHKIVLNHNFIVNDVLEIEYKKRKVTLNGNPLPTSISFESHWFILKPGTMKLRSSHATTLTYKGKYH